VKAKQIILIGKTLSDVMIYIEIHLIFQNI
jgi:hypothetical protein